MNESKWIPRYYDLLLRYLQERKRIEGPRMHIATKQILYCLNSVHCKRMMFDSRQAVVFDKSEPIKLDGDKIKPPFGWFWMEFTEPIRVQAQQPGYEDHLVGFVFNDDAFTKDVITKDGKRRLTMAQVVFVFLANGEPGKWVHRSWSVSIPEKRAVTTQYTMEESGKFNKIVMEDDVAEIDPREHPLFEAGAVIPGQEDREISWWESAIADYTDLLLWILAYCLAKSVRIEEMKLSRQQRRAAERKGEMPTPWHRVFVEPKIVNRWVAGEEGTGREVGHRFDVISHLRFNRHKLADGSWRHTVEIVPDHQRGLKNEIYIPKTYAVAKGKKDVPENAAYFKQEPKLCQ